MLNQIKSPYKLRLINISTKEISQEFDSVSECIRSAAERILKGEDGRWFRVEWEYTLIRPVWVPHWGYTEMLRSLDSCINRGEAFGFD